MSLEDEVEFVKSVYCQDGEFEIVNPLCSEQPALLLSLKNATKSNADINMTMYFANEYPSRIPFVTIHKPNISRDNQKIFNQQLEDFVTSSSLLDSPMVLEVISWCKENVFHFVTCQPSEDNVSELDTNEICIMQLDHMRSKATYTKTLLKWGKQLRIEGMVIFFGKFIFIVLQGPSCDVKEFICRLKSQKVDIDSSGHACKERMLTILLKSATRESKPLSELNVVDVYAEQSLRQLFVKADLQGQYQEFIVPILM